MYSLVTGEKTTYVTWVEQEPLLTDYESICIRAQQIDPQCSTFYLLYLPDLDEYKPDELLMANAELVFSSTQDVYRTGEYYDLYKVTINETAF